MDFRGTISGGVSDAAGLSRPHPARFTFFRSFHMLKEIRPFAGQESLPVL